MKRKDLERLLKKNGWTVHRQGGKHEIWTNGAEKEPIPRHKEIDENLAKAIIKKLGLQG